MYSFEMPVWFHLVKIILSDKICRENHNNSSSFIFENLPFVR